MRRTSIATDCDDHAPELLGVLRRIEVRGRLETCHRTKQRAGQVFRYAIATGRAEDDITADLRDELTPTKTQHFVAITEPPRVGDNRRIISARKASPSEPERYETP